jgi:arylsulfatase A-like enzyme
MSVVDVVPTLIGLLRLSGSERFLEQMSGVDVLSPDFSPRPVLSSSSLRRIEDGFDLELSLTSDRWKYRRRADGREELYDLVADPFELEDLSADHPRILADQRTRLLELYAKQRERGRALGSGMRRDLSPEEVRQLESLGYGVE